MTLFTSPILPSILAPVFAGAVVPTSIQAAPDTPIASLEELSIEEATAPRCAVAFAIVGNWQKNNDPRGGQYPDMKATGGQEFFVRSVAGLMESRGLSREAVSAIMAREARSFSGPDGANRIEQMMPACLLVKQASGL